MGGAGDYVATDLDEGGAEEIRDNVNEMRGKIVNSIYGSHQSGPTNY